MSSSPLRLCLCTLLSLAIACGGGQEEPTTPTPLPPVQQTRDTYLPHDTLMVIELNVASLAQSGAIQPFLQQAAAGDDDTEELLEIIQGAASMVDRVTIGLGIDEDELEVSLVELHSSASLLDLAQGLHASDDWVSAEIHGNAAYQDDDVTLVELSAGMFLLGRLADVQTSFSDPRPPELLSDLSLNELRAAVDATLPSANVRLYFNANHPVIASELARIPLGPIGALEFGGLRYIALAAEITDGLDARLIAEFEDSAQSERSVAQLNAIIGNPFVRAALGSAFPTIELSAEGGRANLHISADAETLRTLTGQAETFLR